ncbi:MAG: hypothetical protein ACJ75S_02870 [Solirubrobacterales bacterium]
MSEPPTPEAVPAATAEGHAPTRSSDALAIAGWITAVVVPLPVGMVIGAILASRDDKRGRWILGVAVGVTVLWILVVVLLLNTAEHQAEQSYYYE